MPIHDLRELRSRARPSWWASVLGFVVAFAACASDSTELGSIELIGSTLAEAIEQHAVGPVEVQVFRDIDREESSYGRHLTSALRTALKAKGVELVEGEAVGDLLEEQEAGRSPIVDPDLRAKTPRFAATQALVLGDLIHDNRRGCVFVKVRLVSVETRVIHAEDAVCVPNSELPDELYRVEQRYTRLDVPPMENGGLRVTVTSVNRHRNNRQVTVEFDLQNVSGQDLRIGLEPGMPRLPNASLSDDEGVTLTPFGDSKGKPLGLMTKSAKADAGDVLSADVKLPLTMTFKTKEGDWSVGQRYNFSVRFIAVAGDSRTRVPFSFGDLKVRVARRAVGR